MKIILLLCFSLFVFHFSLAQTPGEWVWLHGDSVPNLTGSYGVQGIPSSNNEPPSLYEVCEWTDLNGKFWMLGGQSQGGGYLDDLWEYDPATNQWTWMKGPGTSNYAGNAGVKGVASTSNYPPYTLYGAASWVDKQGDLWMFGGYANYCDMWKYHIATNEWTWMSGPGIPNQTGVYGVQGVANALNNPGYRWESAANWTDDNGDLWLFGGYNGSVFNDLWRYNISSNMWTWMKGPQVANQLGVFGTKGVEAAGNTPGARLVYCNWKDKTGNLWLFAGYQYLAKWIFRNDLWRYNVVTNNWAWMSGDSTSVTASIYGTRCTPSSSNMPGGRFENRAQWTDKNGNFWTFGGAFDFFNSFGNDLWTYNLSTNQWMWVNGDTTVNPKGSRGIKGISAPSNRPGGRAGNVGWYDGNCHLYMFGGGSNSLNSISNDLWMYTIDPACGGGGIVCSGGLPKSDFTSSDTVFCTEGGKCISFYDHSTNNPTAWKWYFPGASPDSSNQQNPTNICYLSTGTYSVTLIVTNSSGTDTLKVSPMITVASPPPAPSVWFSHDTLFSSHAGSYQWYFNGLPIAGATDSFYVYKSAGTYSVMISDGKGCNTLSSGLVITGFSPLSFGEELRVRPNPARNEFIVDGLPFIGASLEIYNVFGEKVYGTQIEGGNKKQETINCKQFSPGIYFVKVANEKMNWVGKFIKE